MKKRCLIVIEQLKTGGVETYVKTVAEALTSDFDFYLLARAGEDEEFFLDSFKGVYTISALCKKGELPSEPIARLIVKHKIDFLYINQYDLFYECLLACVQTKVPYLITNHGFLLPRDSWMDYLGEDNYYARNNLVFRECTAATTVGKNQLAFWEENFPVLKNKAKVIENHIDEELFSYTPTTGKRFLAISRLDRDKVVFIEEAISLVEYIQNQKGFSDISLTIVGDGDCRQALEEKNINKGHISFMGEQYEIPKLITGHDVVLGTGRVALESALCGKVTIIMGYYGLHGVLTEKNFTTFAEANFNGSNTPKIQKMQVFEALKDIASGKIDYRDKLRRLVIRQRGKETLREKMLEFFETEPKIPKIDQMEQKLIEQMIKKNELQKEVYTLYRENQNLSHINQGLKSDLARIRENKIFKILRAVRRHFK